MQWSATLLRSHTGYVARALRAINFSVTVDVFSPWVVIGRPFEKLAIFYGSFT